MLLHPWTQPTCHVSLPLIGGNRILAEALKCGVWYLSTVGEFSIKVVGCGSILAWRSYTLMSPSRPRFFCLFGSIHPIGDGRFCSRRGVFARPLMEEEKVENKESLYQARFIISNLSSRCGTFHCFQSIISPILVRSVPNCIDLLLILVLDYTVVGVEVCTVKVLAYNTPAADLMRGEVVLSESFPVWLVCCR